MRTGGRPEVGADARNAPGIVEHDKILAPLRKHAAGFQDGAAVGRTDKVGQLSFPDKLQGREIGGHDYLEYENSRIEPPFSSAVVMAPAESVVRPVGSVAR